MPAKKQLREESFICLKVQGYSPPWWGGQQQELEAAGHVESAVGDVSAQPAFAFYSVQTLAMEGATHTKGELLSVKLCGNAR